MGLYSIFFLIFVHLTLLVPGYVIVKKSSLLAKSPGMELAFGYLVSIALYASLAVTDYAFGLTPGLSRWLCWLVVLAGFAELLRSRYLDSLLRLRLPLICLFLMSVMATAFVGLSLNSARPYVPDPIPQAGRNYDVLAVKILNISHTQANDNSIPYRQAQFFVNKTSLTKGDFINEWNVTFFQRTPLMGSVTATYFNMLNEHPPTDYIWSDNSPDPDHTYLQFQLLAHVLNSLFIIPAFFLLKKLFSKRTAIISCMLLVISPFFLYNATFSWPKSLVAFFILLSWLLILEKKLSCTILAGVASGLAYLTHDLAVLYIAATILLLLWNRRFRDIFLFGITTVFFALPWLLISTLVYHKPSTFILYPLSTEGIPQVDQKQQIINKFFETPIVHLLKIRLDNLIYLLSPYQLFTSEGGGGASVRIWSLGLFSIPGSIGIGLIIPAILGFLKKFRDSILWILIFTPVIAESIVIGWSKGLGALHFAESITVLLCGLGVYFLLQLKRNLWLYLAFSVNVFQLIFLITFSHNYAVSPWFKHSSDILLLMTISAIVMFCFWIIYTAMNKRPTSLLSPED